MPEYYRNPSGSLAVSQQQTCAASPSHHNHAKNAGEPFFAIGSSWDVGTGPEGALPHHLAEWVNGSAVAAELAAANVVSLQGPAVIEALAGNRLEALGGHSGQYATGAVARLLRPLEPIAEAGGWWCSGLDPLADWAPMAWGCFKPDVPRQDQKTGGTIKYDNPWGQPARLLFLKVPAAIAAKVADRFGLPLPIDVGADADGSHGAFWRWWDRTPTLPLALEEGAKKAAALLSIGLPAVATPGIYNPAIKGADGRWALHPDLAALQLQGRQVSVLYDYSPKRQGQKDVALAYRRVGRLLQQAGADVLVGACPGPHKGADDHLVAGGTWEELAGCLGELTRPPVLPHLRRLDRIAPSGCYLGEALGCLPAPEQHRVVAIAAAMGVGKTRAIRDAVAPLMAAGVRVVLITYRKSLGMAQAAELDLPWADDAAPGNDLRQRGIALCIDSLCPGSRLRINPADWSDAVVIMDEATASLRHALQATGTAIGRRRVDVLETLAQLLRQARQVLIADAQLDSATLEALETVCGDRALLIGSEHQPAAGRRLIVHFDRVGWRGELAELLRAKKRLWISTTSAEETSVNSAQNLAIQVGASWSDAKTLVVDAETVNNPDHDAHRLASNPDQIASKYDVIIASPAIAAGLSVTIRGHFDAVMVYSGGAIDPTGIAQAAARVRDDCPRHLYAPDRSPGNALQIGCGSCDERMVLRMLEQHHQIAVAQLVAAGWDPTTNDSGLWLRLWAKQAAHQNAARLAYKETIVGLLEREGYKVERLKHDAVRERCGSAVGKRLGEIAKEMKGAEQDRIIAAQPITDAEARELQGARRRLSPAEKAQLQRWRIARTWGLGQAAPTADVLDANEEGMPGKVVFHWAVTAPESAAAVADHDRQRAREMAPTGKAWAPDLCNGVMGPKVAAAVGLGLPGWLQRTDWFTADDPELVQLDAVARSHGAALTQVLGMTPGGRATTVLRQLLGLAGYKLESQRIRNGAQRGRYLYRVEAAPLPDQIERIQLVRAWLEALGTSGPKNPIQEPYGEFRSTR